MVIKEIIVNIKCKNKVWIITIAIIIIDIVMILDSLITEIITIIFNILKDQELKNNCKNRMRIFKSNFKICDIFLFIYFIILK